MDFFDLTDKQMHHAFCSCHVGAKLTGSEAAKRLRHVVRGNLLRRKMTSALSTDPAHLPSRVGLHHFPTPRGRRSEGQ